MPTGTIVLSNTLSTLGKMAGACRDGGHLRRQKKVQPIHTPSPLDASHGNTFSEVLVVRILPVGTLEKEIMRNVRKASTRVCGRLRAADTPVQPTVGDSLANYRAE
ncbi:unnamed protein product [Arctogadus glacialis]